MQPARRPQGVGQLPADVGDLGDRQEGGHGQQGQKWQVGGGHTPAVHQEAAREHHREPAQGGHDLHQGGLQRQISEERQPHPVVGLDQIYERGLAPLLLLEGDHLGQALDAVDAVGVELAQGLAVARGQAVDAPP